MGKGNVQNIKEDLLKLTKMKSQKESEINKIKSTISQIKQDMHAINSNIEE